MDVAQLPLPRWEVDLHGDDRDLKHLAQYFTGDGLRIYEEGKTGQTLMVVGRVFHRGRPRRCVDRCNRKSQGVVGRFFESGTPGPNLLVRGWRDAPET